MRVVLPLLLLLCACNGEGGSHALGVGVAAGAETEAGADTGCRCVPDRRAGAPTYDCAATALPPGAALCQRGRDTIYCAPEDQRVQTFTGDVSCDPGFCVSLDGESCLVLCECRR